MATPLVLAVVSVGCFLGLAHAAVTSPHRQFRTATLAMASVAGLLAVLAPAAGVSLLAPVLLSRRLANAPIPATVPEFLGRYEPAE